MKLLSVLFVAYCMLGVSFQYVSADSRSTNCLIVIDAAAVNSAGALSELEASVERHGCSIRHVFWPWALFAYAPEGVGSLMEKDSLITAVVRSGLSPSQASGFGLPSWVVSSWNAIVTGKEQRPSVEKVAAAGPIGIASRANDRPPIMEDFSMLEGSVEDFFTSSYLIGRVAVGIFLMESEGSRSTEDWSSADEDSAISGVARALNILAERADEENARVSWYYDIHKGVPTPYEPISTTGVPFFDWWGCRCVRYWWLDDAMSAAGHHEGGLVGIYSYLNSVRRSFQADWAHILFLAKSELDADHAFEMSDGGLALGYAPWFPIIELDWPPVGPEELGSLFAVVGYPGVALEDPLDFVETVIHETVHVFGGAEEGYDCVCGLDDDCVNYLREPNPNCILCNQNPVPCVMLQDGLHRLCPSTRAQLGWRHLYDSDGVPDAIDPNTNKVIVPLDNTPPGSIVKIWVAEQGEMALVKSYACTPDNTTYSDGHYKSIWDCISNWGNPSLPT